MTQESDPTKVLVVEDESIVALDIERGLKRIGYGVAGIADTGRDAIRLADKMRPDLVLMDIQLKGDMDGIEAAQEIRRQFNIPVIFLTAYSDEATLQKAKLTEPFGYLLKPFEETELRSAIEVVLHKHTSVEIRHERATTALRLSEEIFRIFVESVQDYGIFMMDPFGVIMSWNIGAQRIKGYGAKEVIGKHFSLFFPKEDIASQKPERELAFAVREGRYEEEAWQVRKDGTKFWARITITAIRDKEGALLAFGKVTRDLTQQKKFQELLEGSIKARDEFLTIASHELRTPLTALKLQLQMSQLQLSKCEANLKRQEIQPEKLERALSISIRQVDSLTGLVEELLDVGMIQTGRLSLHIGETRLSDLVREVVSRFSPKLTQIKCSLETELEDGIIGHWDAHRIEQVLVNLIGNIVKYAPGARAKISTRRESDRVVLTVEDNGPGIPEEKQEHIFERFERAATSQYVSGLGLGLFVVKHIVECHQGTVQLQSAAGQGSKFTIRLPEKIT